MYIDMKLTNWTYRSDIYCCISSEVNFRICVFAYSLYFSTAKQVSYLYRFYLYSFSDITASPHYLQKFYRKVSHFHFLFHKYHRTFSKFRVIAFVSKIDIPFRFVRAFYTLFSVFLIKP